MPGSGQNLPEAVEESKLDMPQLDDPGSMELLLSHIDFSSQKAPEQSPSPAKTSKKRTSLMLSPCLELSNLDGIISSESQTTILKKMKITPPLDKEEIKEEDEDIDYDEIVLD